LEKTHRNSLQPGYKLQWYEIKEILGQGGFGITYLAHDTNLDEDVAIKEFLPIELAMREGIFLFILYLMAIKKIMSGDLIVSSRKPVP